MRIKKGDTAMVIGAASSVLIQSVPQVSTFPETTERADIVNAGESVVSQIGNDPGPGGRLGTDTGLPRDSRFDDPNAAFDDPKLDLPQIGGFDPAHDLNIPGGEASATWGSLIVSCGFGAAAGAKVGGAWGAAVGCATGVAVGLRDEIAGDTIDKVIDWMESQEEVTPVPMGTPHDMGVSGDPKSDPNPDGDVQGGYMPKFAPPSLGWLNQINVKPEIGDPIGVEKNEPSNVMRFFGQAVDPNPDQDNANDGAAMKAILSTSGAVTDPRPDLGSTLLSLRIGMLRG